LSAFQEADFDECLGVLSQHEGTAGQALRVRCLLRMGRAPDALRILDDADFTNMSHRCAAELLIVRIAAYIMIDDGDGARRSIAEAKARSYGVGSVELESELMYSSALLEWTVGNHAAAKELALALLSNHSSIPAWLRENVDSYPYSRGYWRARSFELLGMTAGLEKDFQTQAAHLMNAFEEFDSASCRDALVEGVMLANLAVLVRDLQDPRITEFVRARLPKISASAALAHWRFQIQHSIGWCSALAGDHLGGLREFRQSAEIAPSIPLRIRAILDRAFIAGQLSEKYFALEQLEHACQLASSIDWDSVVSHDRSILLQLAMAIAPYDAVRARAMLDRHASVRAPISKLSMFAQDRRQRGEDCMAIATVVRAEGQLDRATMLFKEALDIWTDVGYAWRAAAAAIEIYTLTGDTAYLDVVAREAAERPRSWIASRYAAVVLDDPKTFVRA